MGMLFSGRVRMCRGSAREKCWFGTFLCTCFFLGMVEILFPAAELGYAPRCRRDQNCIRFASLSGNVPFRLIARIRTASYESAVATVQHGTTHHGPLHNGQTVSGYCTSAILP